MVKKEELDSPERMGWIPFKKTEMARNGMRLHTALITDESEVKARLNGIRNTKTMVVKRRLIKTEVTTTTTTENRATLGCLLPSSFPTLIL